MSKVIIKGCIHYAVFQYHNDLREKERERDGGKVRTWGQTKSLLKRTTVRERIFLWACTLHFKRNCKLIFFGCFACDFFPLPIFIFLACVCIIWRHQILWYEYKACCSCRKIEVSEIKFLKICMISIEASLAI